MHFAIKNTQGRATAPAIRPQGQSQRNAPRGRKKMKMFNKITTLRDSFKTILRSIKLGLRDGYITRLGIRAALKNPLAFIQDHDLTGVNVFLYNATFVLGLFTNLGKGIRT